MTCALKDDVRRDQVSDDCIRSTRYSFRLRDETITQRTKKASETNITNTMANSKMLRFIINDNIPLKLMFNIFYLKSNLQTHS